MSGAIEEFEVVVVGAGPGGLSSALTLASYDVETLVVDRRPEPSGLPRATVASTGTMELLRRWGLEQAAWQRSIDVEWQAWASETLAGASDGQAVEVGLPTREQAALVSPTRPACIGQDELEPLLEDRVRSLQSARIERGVELAELEPAGDGSHLLTLVGPGGVRRQVRAQYVIGADGIRSKVRAELGIATDGDRKLEGRVAIQFRAPLWDLLGEYRYGIYFMTGEHEGRAFVPAGRGDRWGFALESDFDVATLADGEMKAWIRAAAGDPALPIEIESVENVAFGVGLADRFREGSAFLIGDAAHRVTPRGGTGLNTAIRDGFDLGWKLAWVSRGWDDDTLLDSYERERRPVAEYNTDRSTRPDGSILGTAFGLNVDIGGRIPHVWVPRGEALVSSVDLLGDGLTLFTGPDWDGAVPDAACGSAPMAAEMLDAIAARGLGLTPGGSLLARPDGRPVAIDAGSSRPPTAPRTAAGLEG